MAKKADENNRMTQLNQEIKEGHFKKMYLLTGSEHYLINQYRDFLKNSLVSPDDTMNFSHYDTSNISSKAIANDLITLPFLAEHRVILVEDSGFFTKSDEDLLNAIEKMPDENIIIFCENDTDKGKAVDKRGKLYKLFEKAEGVYNFNTMDEKTILIWLKKKITSAGLSSEDAAIFRLYESAGPDMTSLSNEVEKLIGYCISKKNVTVKDVEEISVSKTEDKVFEMIDAISKHDKKKAILLYNDLVQLREAPMKILVLITRHYNILCQIALMQEEKYDSSHMAKTLKVNPYFLKKYMGIAKQYKYKELLAAANSCADADYAIKTGALSDKDSLEKLLIKLM